MVRTGCVEWAARLVAATLTTLARAARCADHEGQLSKPSDREFIEYLKRGDALHKEVKNVTESLADADWFSKMAKYGANRASQLGNSTAVFKPADYIGRLRAEYGGQGNSLRWLDIGLAVETQWRWTPAVDVVYGTIAKVPPRAPRQAAVRRDKVHGVAAQASRISKEEANMGEKEATARAIHLHYMLEYHLAQAQERGLTFTVPVLLHDEESFARTVENYFDFSFLVKDNRWTMASDDNMPSCTLRDIHDETTERVPNTQAVVRVTMAAHRSMSEVLRNGSLDRRAYVPTDEDRIAAAKFADEKEAEEEEEEG